MNGITAMVAQMRGATIPARPQPDRRLTDAERLEVQRLIAEGLDNKEIEWRTGISYALVSRTRARLRQLGAHPIGD